MHLQSVERRSIEDGKEDKAQNAAFRAFQREGIRQGRSAGEITTRNAMDQGILQNRRIIEQLFEELETQENPHLVIYFHGGLVNAGRAKTAVIPFDDALQAEGYTPLFWLWHSDAPTQVRDAWQTFTRTLRADAGAGLRYLAQKLSDLFRTHPLPAGVRYLRRYQQGIPHSALATYLEESLRGTVPGNAIAGLWSEMKEDIHDAFATHTADLRAGTYFLDCLAAASQKYSLKVSLIGHSGGAAYICALLNAAATRAINFRFEHIVFWAAGVNFPAFHDTIIAHPDTYSTFSLFGLPDHHERADPLYAPGTRVPLYPHSLLYLVAGALEGQNVAPLVGLEHYADPRHRVEWERTPFNTAMHRTVRAFLNQPGRSHWLENVTHHGGFIANPDILSRTLDIL